MDALIQPLADAIYADKVRRARSLTIAERIETTLELSGGALGLMEDGIRSQFATDDEKLVQQILLDRLRRLKRLEDHGIYMPAPAA